MKYLLDPDKLRRAAQGLTQTEIAESLGVAQPTVSKMMREPTDCTVQVFTRLTELLSVEDRSIDCLLSLYEGDPVLRVSAAMHLHDEIHG